MTKETPFAPITRRARLAAGLMALCLASTAFAAQPSVQPVLLDDFSDPTRNKHGIERLLVDDKTAGSQSQATQKCAEGILAIKGELVPGRGVPAFISLVSLLSPGGKPKDMTGYQGVRLRVKVIKGILCVQVASSEITNFDFHTGSPIAGTRTGFQEIRVPFTDMKRAWSEPMKLNLKSITSINLVSFGMAKDAFSYEVDEIGFY